MFIVLQVFNKELFDMELTLNGKWSYKVSAEPTIGSNKPTYTLTGKRGAKYYTCRLRDNQDLLFLFDDNGQVKHKHQNIWLTDKEGGLEVVRS